MRRIADAACPDPAGTVLEIGPGRGALTGHLLARAARVVAVEVDGELIPLLSDRFGQDSRFELVHSDILTADLSGLGPLFVAGNLPYYITSPILSLVFRLRPQWLQAVFLIQREVAERLVARPGTRDYGYLSVQAQFHAQVELLFPVDPGAFAPPPKVESAVVRLTPRAELPTDDAKGFLAFAGHCFSHKRKTLRNNLRPHYPIERIDALPEAGCRAEQLSVAELLQVHRQLEERGGVPDRQIEGV